MKITSELVAECSEPGRGGNSGQSNRGCTVREPPVVPQDWNTRSYRKAALDGAESVGGAEMRQWVWGLPSLQKAVGKTGLYSGH